MAFGHSSLLIPPSRNSIDRLLGPWKGGSMGDGKFGPDGWGCNCINATTDGQVPCDVGQSCFWFSNGCSIGCAECDGGAAPHPGANPNTVDRCNSGAVATINDPKYRTYNREAIAGSAADIYKHNPWRAPGTAPVFDTCGMAGGFTHQEAGEAKYTATANAAQGKKGSTLPPAPSGTVWVAGSQVQTAISIRANHGGGYSFRLCPADADLTEECFQQTPLKFVEGRQTLRWANGTELGINGTYIDVGTHPPGSSWAMNPLPYSNSNSGPQFPPPCHEKGGGGGGIPPTRPHDCKPRTTNPVIGFDECDRTFCDTDKHYDYTSNGTFAECAARCVAINCTCFDYDPTSKGTHPFEHCRIAARGKLKAITASSMNYTSFIRPGPLPPAPPSGPSGQVTDGYCSGQFPYNVMVLDTVEVPTNLAKGEYVLGFRWDCEKSAQVWAACADVTIT